MWPYRVFVSYAHEDRAIAELVVSALVAAGIQPIWDKDIRPGMSFTDAIKDSITLSHIFMPIITENSQRRPWVHQETGYAMALEIPVLPLAVGNLPGEMIAQYQAITIQCDGSDIQERLAEVDLARVVSPPPSAPRCIFEVAEWPEERTVLMAQYANRVAEMGSKVHVYQCGALSSFSIPDCDTDSPLWQLRDGDHPRSDYYHHLQREERRALERHAREAGCSLIIDPSIDFSKAGTCVTHTRLSILLGFLESMSNDKVQVVVSSRARGGNWTILGDWFTAETSQPKAGGYRQTIFRWHAPFAIRRLERFKAEFDELIAKQPGGAAGSLEYAMVTVRDLLKTLPTEICEPPDIHTATYA